MQTVSIYILKDPTTGDVRYIGKSIHPEVRLAHHTAGGGGIPQVTAWIRDLTRQGKAPILEVVEAVHAKWAKFAEVQWIIHFERQGVAFRWSNRYFASNSPLPGLMGIGVIFGPAVIAVWLVQRWYSDKKQD